MTATSHRLRCALPVMTVDNNENQEHVFNRKDTCMMMNASSRSCHKECAKLPDLIALGRKVCGVIKRKNSLGVYDMCLSKVSRRTSPHPPTSSHFARVRYGVKLRASQCKQGALQPAGRSQNKTLASLYFRITLQNVLSDKNFIEIEIYIQYAQRTMSL